MNWKRTLIVTTAFALAATVYTPRFSGSYRHYYQFAVLIENGQRLDYNQWIVNLLMAVACGFLAAQIPFSAWKWIGICIASIAAVVVLVFGIIEASHQREELRKQARSNESIAQHYILANRIGEAKRALASAASKWRDAGDISEQSRVDKQRDNLGDLFDLPRAVAPSSATSFDPDAYLANGSPTPKRR